jgi:hypothetical protein
MFGRFFDRAIQFGVNTVVRVQDELNEESNAHKQINGFIIKVEELALLHQNDLPPASKNAAAAMIGELKKLLKNDSRTLGSRIPLIQHQLLTDALDIIGKYERSLEVAPGFFNQLKAMINNLIEALTGLTDVLDVEKTAIGADAPFQHKKYDLESEKVSLENPEPEEGLRI